MKNIKCYNLFSNVASLAPKCSNSSKFSSFRVHTACSIYRKPTCPLQNKKNSMQDSFLGLTANHYKNVFELLTKKKPLNHNNGKATYHSNLS